MNEEKPSGREVSNAFEEAMSKYLEYCGWTLEKDDYGFGRWIDPITQVPHYSINAVFIQYDRNAVNRGFKFPQRPMRATPERTTPCSVDDLTQ